MLVAAHKICKTINLFSSCILALKSNSLLSHSVQYSTLLELTQYVQDIRQLQRHPSQKLSSLTLVKN